MKRGYCLIQETCYATNQYKPGNRCLVGFKIYRDYFIIPYHRKLARLKLTGFVAKYASQ